MNQHAESLDRYGREDRAASILLLSMEAMGPARLRWLLADRSPVEAIELLAAGQIPVDPPQRTTRSIVAKWMKAARVDDIDELLRRHDDAGIQVLMDGDEHWPLASDPEPPGLLFVKGSAPLLGRGPSVAIVGTRRCTSIGTRVADALGRDLSAVGVNVVSGLALGIDGASHRGVLSEDGPGRPIAVVSCGLDTIYPRRHARLCSEVEQAGAVISEWPLGVEPSRWKFPARNRIIAGLADLVVVVESHLKGGALSTADEALARAIPVAAIPGSVLSAASEGTNQLLIDGAIPIRGANDILDLLSIDHGRLERAAASATQTTIDFDSLPDPQNDRAEHTNAPDGAPIQATDDPILFELSSGSCTIDRLVEATGMPLQAVMGRVQGLQLSGVVRLDGALVMLL